MTESRGAEEFEFSEGDTVTVRVRENGTTGNIVVKFTAECERIESKAALLAPSARFDLPGTMNSVSYAPHEAEFEVADD